MVWLPCHSSSEPSALPLLVLGMKVATKANVRTANAARNSLGKSSEIAFSGGAVMGLGVVGLGILGLGGLFYIFEITSEHSSKTPTPLVQHFQY